MSFSFLFGIHCHQPVDNFKHIVDEVTLKSYLPFIESASNYKEFNFAVHFSGWLLEFIKNNHPDLFKMFQKLSNEGQVEFFSGGFYEPVLSAIPKRDRICQIKKLNQFIHNNFGQKPRGLWLTERVWDPSIIPDLAECGIEYIVVDDYHFISIGFHKDSLYGYFVTEQDGVKMNIFPIDQKLRYIIPFKEPEDILSYTDGIMKKGGKSAIIFDDGEKFGVWPKTYEWVYEKGWLKRFFESFMERKDISFKHFYQFVEENKPLGLAYLPLTSYKEMGEWSLFADKFTQMERFISFVKRSEFADVADIFVKGAHWKNFFVKYPESNHIHKRILKISEKAKELKNDYLDDLLFRAECNDVLWHGIFGGIYLPNLRDNAFRYIIKAEKEVEKMEKSPDVMVDDLLLDGYGTAMLRNDKVNLLFTAKHGGQLKSFDIKEFEINILNTLSRRWEGYHDALLNSDKVSDEELATGITTIHEMKVSLDEDIKKQIAFDWYDRNSFVDHFVDAFKSDEIAMNRYRELGDFANQPFDMELKGGVLSFKRVGGIYMDKRYNTVLEKQFSLKEDKLQFSISIDTDYSGDLWYLMEMNFHFFEYENLVINKKIFKKGFATTAKRIEVNAGNISLKILLNKSTDMFAYSVDTVHQSEQGVDFTTQGVAFVFPFKLSKTLKVKGEIYL
ncbi:MAG: alpha-amylase/4-alpha-glucanotransferase domain-containing protein [Calditerrivibrio sp.]|uniref:alpha-amylase/4-alpha-glucanotransferase domain-containing protein n=1 Tax=Calditerrivibrio sp. TaxID=2792612 RepID=UPI003D12C242